MMVTADTPTIMVIFIVFAFTYIVIRPRSRLLASIVFLVTSVSCFLLDGQVYKIVSAVLFFGSILAVISSFLNGLTGNASGSRLRKVRSY